MDTLTNIWWFMNRIITRRDLNRKHLTKDILFNIQSLADQFYGFYPTIFEELKIGKIYFSKNLVPYLSKKGIKQLHILVWDFNWSLQRDGIDNFSGAIENKDITIRTTANRPIEFGVGGNEENNNLFQLHEQDEFLSKIWLLSILIYPWLSNHR